MTAYNTTCHVNTILFFINRYYEGLKGLWSSPLLFLSEAKNLLMQ